MAAPYRQTSRTAYQDYAQQLSPTALLSKNGAAFEAALGAMKDYAVDRLIASVKARFPGIAPSDALNVIGTERGIPRGQSEGDAAYAARLVAAWQTWPWAGTPYGMLTAFRSTGYTNVVVAQTVGGKQFTLDVNGNLVTGGNGSWTPTYVGDPFWSRFDVIFPSPLPAAWQSGVPTSNSGEATFVRAIIAAWKPGHATCNRIVIAGAPAVKWGAQNWGGFTYSAADGAGNVFGLQPTFWGARNWGGFTYRNAVWGGAPTKWGGSAWGFFRYSAASSGAPTWGGNTTVVWLP